MAASGCGSCRFSWFSYRRKNVDVAFSCSFIQRQDLDVGKLPGERRLKRPPQVCRNDDHRRTAALLARPYGPSEFAQESFVNGGIW